MEVGRQTNVPIDLVASTPLANLTFSVSLPTDRLTSLSLENLVPAIASADARIFRSRTWQESPCSVARPIALRHATIGAIAFHRTCWPKLRVRAAGSLRIYWRNAPTPDSLRVFWPTTAAWSW